MCDRDGKFLAGQLKQLGKFVGQKIGEVSIGGVVLHKISVLRSDRDGQTPLLVNEKVLKNFKEFDSPDEAMKSLRG